MAKEKLYKERRLTFDEQIEISGIQDDIQTAVDGCGQYWDKLVNIGLRKIARISYAEADKTITKLGLNKRGWSRLNKRGRSGEPRRGG